MRLHDEEIGNLRKKRREMKIGRTKRRENTTQFKQVVATSREIKHFSKWPLQFKIE
jgi:hypothetical protein